MSGKGFGSLPPLSETGVIETIDKINDFEVGIDWLTFTCGEATFLEVYPYLMNYFDDQQLPVEQGRRFWENHIRTFKGLYMNFGRRDTAPPLTPYACLSIPGSLWATLTVCQQLELIKYLRSKNVNVTRIDTKLDDYTRAASPERALQAARDGNYSGFRVFSTRSENKGNGEQLTVYFGTRGKNGSGKYLRIYDRLNTTGGEQNCYRLEAEFTQCRSKTVFAELSTSTDSLQFSKRLHGFIVGIIDFIRRDASSRYDRSTRLDWWEKIVNGQLRLKVTITKPKPVIQKTIDAFRKQWAPSFFMLFECLGGDDFWKYIDSIMRDGEERLSEFQKAWIEYFKSEDTTLLPDGRFIVNHGKPVQLAFA